MLPSNRLEPPRTQLLYAHTHSVWFQLDWQHKIHDTAALFGHLSLRRRLFRVYTSDSTDYIHNSPLRGPRKRTVDGFFGGKARLPRAAIAIRDSC